MKEIILTQGRVALVNDEDFEWLNQWKWHATKKRNTFYAVRTEKKINGKRHTLQMHRVILSVSNDMEVDHKSGNGLDNQRGNLRICIHQENMMNQKPFLNCSSAYKGVDWHHRKWRARIQPDGKEQHLGYFNLEIKAAKKYDEAARQLFGEFARTNF